MIPGPAAQPELEEFFETTQRLDAKLLAEEHGFEYYRAEREDSLKEILKGFYSYSVQPKLLEIPSESKINAKILKETKACVTQIFGL